MRHQGRITSWKDDQGYGFITPNGGGPEVFVHIRALSEHQRRPAGNEIVTYDLTVNGKGQRRAENVAFVRPRAAVGGAPRDRGTAGGTAGGSALLIPVCFLGGLAIAVLAGALPPLILGCYLGASAIAFFAYARDKSAARNNRWRIREDTLHLFSIAGGWPGALIAQRLLRHKSKKASFQRIFWCTVVLNCGALIWLLTPSGSRMLAALAGSP